MTTAGRRPIRWTPALLVVLGAVFAAQTAAGLHASVVRAGLVKDAVRAGETWRLATAVFLHGGALHLLVNGYALWNLGNAIEFLGSRAHLSVAFLVSAIAGSVASLCLMPSATSVGASGGLMGLLGFLCALGLKYRRVLHPRFLRSLGLNVLLMAGVGYVASDMIDNAAHGGGLVGGFLVGLLATPRRAAWLPLVPSRAVRLAGGVAALCIVLAGALAAWKVLGR